MTCAAKRGSQLSNGLSSAIRTLVFCSAEIRRVLHCRFTSLTTHFHTTVGHVHPQVVNHRILESFSARFIITFQNDSAKTKIFHETNKK